jgi:uncharacterized membrane protein
MIIKKQETTRNVCEIYYTQAQSYVRHHHLDTPIRIIIALMIPTLLFHWHALHYLYQSRLGENEEGCKAYAYRRRVDVDAYDSFNAMDGWRRKSARGG